MNGKSLAAIMKRQDLLDVDLDKFAAENMSSSKFQYKGRPGTSYNETTKAPIHPSVDFITLSNESSYSIVVVKKVSEKENDETHMIKLISKMENFIKKTHFVRSVYVNKRIYMDYFNYDLYKFLTIRSDKDWDGLQSIFIFCLQSLNILMEKNKCFTDIKLDQVLVRLYVPKRGSYYNVFTYFGQTFEIALSDLDMKNCDTVDAFMLTNQYPETKRLPLAKQSEKQVLWSLGIMALEIFGNRRFVKENGSFVGTMNSIPQIKDDVDRLPIVPVLKTIIKNCFDPNVTRWQEGVVNVIDLKERAVSRRG